ncbi:MAG TPA: hypothetical protein VMI54_30455 [Polyangiaceae bacterium]|nr:hypothetical protein [Polyangiaceae bacterium]
MRGRAGAVVWTLSALAVLSRAESARAAPALQSFSVEYSAAEGCPARATFVASILARAPGSHEASEDPELAFAVHIVEAGERTRGTLTVRFAHGEHFEREVPASRCADVATSMAIMAGLLLSGALLPEPAPAPPAEPPPNPAENPEPAPPPAVHVRASAPVARTPEARARPVSIGRVRLGVFAAEAVALDGLPFPALGVDTGAEVALDRSSVLAPSLRAGFSYFASKASRAPTGDGLFVLRALALRACPLRLELGAPLVLHACALFDAGRLDVSGRNTTNPLERHMTWLALGPAARLEARLGRVVSLELEGSLFGLVHHDAFVLEPDAVKLYEIPAFSGTLAAGVVARLP